MSTSSRGAVIVTAMLAGTLGLASFVVMSGPAVGHRSPAPAGATQTLGSSPRTNQVRPADVATPSSSPTVTVTPRPTASPTAQPSAAPTTEPVAVATPGPTTAPAPRTTPRPAPASTPKPVTTVTRPLPLQISQQVRQRGQGLVACHQAVDCGENEFWPLARSR